MQDIYSLRLHIWSIYKFIDTCTVCVRETYPNLELVEQVAGHMRQVSVDFDFDRGHHDCVGRNGTNGSERGKALLHIPPLQKIYAASSICFNRQDCLVGISDQ